MIAEQSLQPPLGRSPAAAAAGVSVSCGTCFLSLPGGGRTSLTGHRPGLAPLTPHHVVLTWPPRPPCRSSSTPCPPRATSPAAGPEHVTDADTLLTTEPHREKQAHGPCIAKPPRHLPTGPRREARAACAIRKPPRDPASYQGGETVVFSRISSKGDDNGAAL